MERRTVAIKGSYMCCWISFNGAMGGALRAQGVECDLVDVSGRTGYAFLLNVPKGRMCPSAPTALEDSVYREMVKGAGELGAEGKLWTEPGGYMGNAGPDETERERARRLFEMVKGEIDLTGRPVVLWGLPIPEFGIVNGYEGTRYVASTYRSMDAPEKEELVEDRKHADALIEQTEKSIKDLGGRVDEAIKGDVDVKRGSLKEDMKGDNSE